VEEGNLYLKVEMYIDSYGEEDNIRGIAFVKAKQIDKLEYEAI
jgi:hypothetical protein